MLIKLGTCRILFC